MQRYIIFVGMVLCGLIMACTESTQDQQVNATKAALAILKEASEKQKQNPDVNTRLTFWNKQLANPRFNTDSVLRSKIHYNIAGVFYAMGKLDSLKKHMQIAWALMENQAGYDEDKVQLYFGLGNVAHLEQKSHQENYYYNRAAQMLLADTSLKLTPKQKISVYFSAAQSSAQLRQFDNAFIMNRQAMKLLPELKEHHKEQFRAFSQMAACYSASNRSLDSLHFYIQKMEQVYIESPAEDARRFIFDRKAAYFTKKEMADSAIFYNRKRLAMDIQEAVSLGGQATSITTGNLYTSYTDMAGVLILVKQLDSAGFYLKKCEDFLKKFPGRVDDECLILYGQNKVDYLFATKNYTAAEQEQNRLSLRVKFLYETENARAVAEMGALFQLQAKDKSIHHLNETVVLAQTKLQQNRLWLAVSTLAFLLAVTLALLLYFIQRQRRLKNETEKVQLQQRLLRTQMEPHFIFNTLSALQSFIRFNENEKALKYLHQFGRLLRSSLELSRESAVKLSEEIDALENYLSLQQMRYDDAFKYALNIDPAEDTESIYVPPMLMQPFVENAILHGINPNGKDGIIIVNFEVSDVLLVVTITDNGSGISVQPKDAHHRSLSTTISRERLAILAKELGGAAQIDIKSDPESGTSVILSIPIKH